MTQIKSISFTIHRRCSSVGFHKKTKKQRGGGIHTHTHTQTNQPTTMASILWEKVTSVRSNDLVCFPSETSIILPLPSPPSQVSTVDDLSQLTCLDPSHQQQLLTYMKQWSRSGGILLLLFGKCTQACLVLIYLKHTNCSLLQRSHLRTIITTPSDPQKAQLCADVCWGAFLGAGKGVWSTKLPVCLRRDDGWKLAPEYSPIGRCDEGWEPFNNRNLRRLDESVNIESKFIQRCIDWYGQNIPAWDNLADEQIAAMTHAAAMFAGPRVDVSSVFLLMLAAADKHQKLQLFHHQKEKEDEAEEDEEEENSESCCWVTDIMNGSLAPRCTNQPTNKRKSKRRRRRRKRTKINTNQHLNIYETLNNDDEKKEKNDDVELLMMSMNCCKSKALLLLWGIQRDWQVQTTIFTPPPTPPNLCLAMATIQKYLSIPILGQILRRYHSIFIRLCLVQCRVARQSFAGVSCVVRSLWLLIHHAELPILKYTLEALSELVQIKNGNAIISFQMTGGEEEEKQQQQQNELGSNRPTDIDIQLYIKQLTQAVIKFHPKLHRSDSKAIRRWFRDMHQIHPMVLQLFQQNRLMGFIVQAKQKKIMALFPRWLVSGSWDGVDTHFFQKTVPEIFGHCHAKESQDVLLPCKRPSLAMESQAFPTTIQIKRDPSKILELQCYNAEGSVTVQVQCETDHWAESQQNTQSSLFAD